MTIVTFVSNIVYIFEVNDVMSSKGLAFECIAERHGERKVIIKQSFYLHHLFFYHILVTIRCDTTTTVGAMGPT